MQYPIKIKCNEPFDTGYEVSIKELADANGLDYLEAQGFIKALVKLGVAKQVKSRKVEGARGKPTNIYLIPTYIEVSMFEDVKEAA